MGRTRGRGSYQRGFQSSQGQDQAQGRGGYHSAKRFRTGSSDIENDDPEVLLDVFVGILNDQKIMDKFVASLCDIPHLKSKLVEHLLPSLDAQIADILTPLRKNVEIMSDKLTKSEAKCEELEWKNDDLEQYTRRQSIRIAGIPEKNFESTDDEVLKFSNDVLNSQLEPGEIDRSHRVGPPRSNDSKQKPREIIVRFVSYKSRQKLLKCKKTMHEFNKSIGTNYLMYEDLTRKRSELAYNARWLKNNNFIKETWTFDGKVFIKMPDDRIFLCTRPSDFPTAFQQHLPINNKPSKPDDNKTGKRPSSYAKAVKTNKQSSESPSVPIPSQTYQSTILEETSVKSSSASNEPTLESGDT
ncbi:uncharacterized protein [Mytilus edulis]|uniref:uncharacterized protein n=1 Tax=Mytilus edulis TaxID=6550 RepID=UPI0039F0B682